MPTAKKTNNKENPKPDIKKVVKVVKESKEIRFNRLAKVRVERLLSKIRILGNCSNRSNYSYTKEQIEKISERIYESLGNMFSKFTQSKKEQESFTF